MTVIYIIQACQVGNVSIVVIQIKPCLLYTSTGSPVVTQQIMDSLAANDLPATEENVQDSEMCIRDRTNRPYRIWRIFKACIRFPGVFGLCGERVQ